MQLCAILGTDLTAFLSIVLLDPVAVKCFLFRFGNEQLAAVLAQTDIWIQLNQIQQKETFQKFKDSYLDLLTLGERDAFIRGFSLGIKIAVEALNYGKT